MENTQPNATPFFSPGMQGGQQIDHVNLQQSNPNGQRSHGNGNNGRGRGNTKGKNKRGGRTNNGATNSRAQGHPGGGYVQHPQPVYNDVNWTHMPAGTGMANTTMPFPPPVAPVGMVAGLNASFTGTPPMPMASTSSFGGVGVSGSRSSSYTTNPSPRQFAPTLHAPTPQRHAKIVNNPYNLPANNAGPPKPMSVAPTYSATPSMLSVAKRNVSEGARAASVDISGATSTITFNPDKQNTSEKREKNEEKWEPHNPYADYSALQHLAALSATARFSLMEPLADHRTAHLEAQEAITVRRTEILDVLGSYISSERHYESRAREYQDLVATNLELAVKRPPGDSKDKYLQAAAYSMRKASEHSTKALDCCVSVARYKDMLEELNREAVKALEKWYEAMHKEIVRVLESAVVPIEKEDEQWSQREMREWQERIDANLASRKTEEEQKMELTDESKKVNEGAKTDSRKSSVGDTNVKTAGLTMGEDKSASKKVTAEPSKDDKGHLDEGQQTSNAAFVNTEQPDTAPKPKKKNNKNKASRKKKGGMDSGTSSLAALNEPKDNKALENKGPEKKGSVDSRASSTAPKNEKRGQGQIQSQEKVQGAKT